MNKQSVGLNSCLKLPFYSPCIGIGYKDDNWTIEFKQLNLFSKAIIKQPKAQQKILPVKPESDYKLMYEGRVNIFYVQEISSRNRKMQKTYEGIGFIEETFTWVIFKNEHVKISNSSP
jgi:hypothetical protein